MNVYVSPYLSQNEREIVNSDFRIVFPGAIESINITPQTSFKIITNKEFSNVDSFHSKPYPITSTTLRNILQKAINVSQLTVPDCGLKNLHLYQKTVAFSGIQHSKRCVYKRIVRQMGGIPASTMSKKNIIFNN
jgi:hypothetical protein